MPVYLQPQSLEFTSLNQLVVTIAEAIRSVHRPFPHDLKQWINNSLPSFLQKCQEVLIDQVMVQGADVSSLHIHVKVTPSTPSLSLSDASTVGIMHLVWDKCKEVYTGLMQVHRYIQTIPHLFANAYMEAILKLAEVHANHSDTKLYLWGAFHRKCTRLRINRSFNTDAADEAINHLPIMRDLTYAAISTVIARTSVARLVQSLPYLNKLQTLHLPEAIITDEYDLATVLSNHCPNLQDLCFHWDLTTQKQFTLAGCPNLQSVSVMYTGDSPAQVVNILDTVPKLAQLSCRNHQLIAQVIQTPRERPYGLKTLDLIFDIPHMLPRLVSTFSNLAEIFLRLPDDPLTPLNDLQHLRRLSVCQSPAERIRELTTCLTRLTTLDLMMVERVDVALSLQMSSLPNVTVFSTWDCNCLDLEQLWCLFPNLTSLSISECSMALHLPKMGMLDTPFRHLKYLDIMDTREHLNIIHLRCLTSHCSDITELELFHGKVLTDAVFSKMITDNPMRSLRKLCLTSSGMTLEILPIVFNSFGPDLESVTMYFQELEASPVEVVETFRQYDHFSKQMDVMLMFSGSFDSDEEDEGEEQDGEDNDSSDDEGDGEQNGEEDQEGSITDDESDNYVDNGESDGDANDNATFLISWYRIDSSAEVIKVMAIL